MVRDDAHEDAGKKVLTADGEMVGRVSHVAWGEVHVEPAPNLPDSVRGRLGWTERGENSYLLRPGVITEVDDETIRLKEDV